MRQWVDAWRMGGASALAPRPRVRRRRVDLERVGAVLKRELSASRGQLTTLGARKIIERTWGVRYCASSARSILHRLGFEYSRQHGWRRSGELERRTGTLEAKRRAS